MVFVFFMLLGCNNDKNDVLVLKNFSIEFISSKPRIIMQSDDGYQGKLLLTNLDTVYFNFGYDINSLTEKDPAMPPRGGMCSLIT